jgi:hypothetical protein
MQQELEWASTHPHHHAGRDLRDHEPPLPGEVVFLSEEEQAQRSAELLGAGALLITLPAPTRDTRGHLGEVLEELVERELARMGAPSPYLAAWTATPEDAQARIADQLFRARSVGASGIAIAMGSLAAIATPVLTPDDNAMLRWLAQTTGDASLVLLVDDSDLGLLGYPAPVSLTSLLKMPPRRPAGPPVEAAADVELVGNDATSNDTRVAPVASIDLGEAILQAPPSVPEAVAVVVAAAAPAPEEPEPVVVVAPDPIILISEPPPAPDPELPVVEAPAPSPPPVVAASPVESPIRALAAPIVPNARRAARRVTVGIPVSGPNDAWRTWTIALSSAKGAQPLALFERLFAESYVPLANAIAAGLDDARALRAYDEFRRSFERSYTDAFTTFGATNRRPRLVMDAYDVASKQARLSNARSAHILVIDSMRYDLGCLIRDAISREAAGVATLTSETVLFSALPTTTMRQLETFARGLDALRAPAREEPSESLRGRAAEVVRRLRVGSRELFKLDLVPSMLETRDPHEPVTAALEGIATAVGEAVARHISTLSPRTLLFVVGDHGFTLGRRGEVQFGGASPEEVLVPAYSWLIGELH